jgi:hypothetical protein
MTPKALSLIILLSTIVADCGLRVITVILEAAPRSARFPELGDDQSRAWMDSTSNTVVQERTSAERSTPAGRSPWVTPELVWVNGAQTAVLSQAGPVCV